MFNKPLIFTIVIVVTSLAVSALKLKKLHPCSPELEHLINKNV